MAKLFKLFSPGGSKKEGSVMNQITNAGWLTGGRLIGDILNLLLFVVLSRCFGPVGIGQYAYALAIAGIVFSIVNFGLEDYAIRECARMSSEEKTILISKVLGVQIGIIGLVLVGLFLFFVFTEHTPQAIVMILMLSVYQFTTAFSRTFFVPSFAVQSFRTPVIIETFCRAGIVMLTLLLVLRYNVVMSTAFVTFPIGGLVLLVFAVKSARRQIKISMINFEWNYIVEILQSAWPFAMSIMVFYINERLGIIIIAMLLGEIATGIYATSLKIVEVGVVPLAFLALATYPALSLLFEKDEQEYLETANRLLRLAVVLGAVITWILFFLAPQFLIPIFGEKFALTIPLIKIMAFIVLVRSVSGTLRRMMLTAGLQVVRVKIQGVCTIVRICLVVGLVPLLGIFGVVVASLVVPITMHVLSLIALRERVDISILIKTIGLFIVILALVVTVGMLSSWLYPGSWIISIVCLVTFIILVVGTEFVPIKKINLAKSVT